MGSGTITLVSYLVAREGYTFLFTGPSPECMNCRFRKVCVDKLREGHTYRVVRVLGIKNRCPINKYVITVAVEEVAVPAAIPKRYGVEGMIFRYRKIDCNNTECEFFKLCRPDLLPDEGKVKVVSVGERLKCPRGESLVKAEIMVVD